MLINGPDNTKIEIENIILDLNGTLSNFGIVSDKTKLLLKQLKQLNYNIVLISGDIRGNASVISKELDLKLYLGANSAEKAKQMQCFDKSKTAAIGNARIDIGTFQNAEISIATLQAEGIHPGILEHVDILVSSIEEALTLFTEPKALEATLRV